MKGKNILAALMVTLFSVALAIGITFVAARGKSLELTVQTPQSTNDPVDRTPSSGLPVVQVITSPTALPTENCTFSIEVWVHYPDAWKIDSYRIGNKTYAKKEMMDLLRSNSTDVRGRLLTEIIVALLNQQNGADVTNIRSAFVEGINWLERFAPGSTPSDGDLQKANSITKTLASFNEGSLGPQSCTYDLAAATAVPQALEQSGAQITGTVTLTGTPNRVIRIPPTETPQPREKDPVKPTRPPATAIPPTRVPPTSIPPTEPPDTPVPTEPPPPPPPPTDAPTDPPPVTDATSPPPPPPPTTAPQPPSAGVAPAYHTAMQDFNSHKNVPGREIYFSNLFFITGLTR